LEVNKVAVSITPFLTSTAPLHPRTPNLEPAAVSARGVRPVMLHDKENNNPADAQPGKLQRAAAGTGREPLADASPPPAGEPMEFAIRVDDAVLNEKIDEGEEEQDGLHGLWLHPSIPYPHVCCELVITGYRISSVSGLRKLNYRQKNGPVTCHSIFPFNNN